MTAAMKWTFGGVAAAIAVASVALFTGDAPWSTTAPPAPGRERPEVAVAAATPDARNEHDATSPSARDAVASAAAASNGQFTIRGRCVDENGAPLPALPVKLHGGKVEGGMGKDFEGEYAEWLAAGGDRRWQNQAADTGPDGRFEFAGEPSPLTLVLWIVREAVDHTVSFHQIQEAVVHDVGDLVIPRACVLHCRVVDELGRAVPSPAVRIDEDRFGSTAASHAVVSRTGIVRAAGDGAVTSTVVAGRYRCEVAHRNIVRGDSVEVPARVGAWEHEIVVAAAATDETIRGTVVDERGAPIADAEVFASREVHSAARTDPAGRFTLQRGAQPDGDVEITAYRDDREPAGRAVRARWGRDDLKLVLRDLVAVDVRVVDDVTGEPVTDYKVRTWPAPDDPVAAGGPSRDSSGRHANGVVRLPNLVRGRHLLIVEPHGRELWRSDAVRFEAAATHVNTVDVRLRPSASRPLLIVTSDDKPVSRASVELLDANAGAPEPVTAGTRARTLDMSHADDVAASRVLLQKVKADPAGAVLLHGPAGRPVVVRIADPRLQPFCVGPVSLDDPTPLVVRIPVGARLVARITPPEFVAELREVRGQNRKPGFRLRRGSGSDAEFVPPQSDEGLEVSADGVVTIDGVVPGNWQLALEPFEETTVQTPQGATSIKVAWQAVPFAGVTLRAGETTEATFDLSSWRLSTVSGVVRCNGEPVANARVYVWVSRQQFGSAKPAGWWMDAQTDAAARFRYRGRAGTVRVLVNRGDPWMHSPDRRWVLSQTIAELPVNATIERDFDVVSCRFRLRVVGADGSPVPATDVLLVSPDLPRHLPFGRTDADGRVAGEAEPGAFEVQLGPQRTRVGTVTIAPGTSNDFELRGPAGMR